MKGKTALKYTATVGLSLGALYFAFRNVPFSGIVQYLGQVQYLWIIPAVLAIILAFMLRILRWQLILNATTPVTFTQAWHPLMAGFMFNCVLPARAGEIARPLMLKLKSGVSFTKGAGSVILERLFDMAFLVLVFFAALQRIDIDPGLEFTFGRFTLNKALLMALQAKMYAVLVIIAAVVALFAVKITRDMLFHLVDRLPGKTGIFVRTNAENLAAAFGFVKNLRLLIYCSLLTVLIWGLHAFSYYLMGVGAPGIDLSFLEMFFMMVIICFFISLPSVPGFWGLWEAGGMFALAIFGVPSTAGSSFTLLNHAIQMLPVILIGFFSFLAMGFNLRSFKADFKEAEKDTNG